MLPMILFNVVSSLVAEMASHVDMHADKIGDIIDDLIPASAKKELDKAIKDDPTHTFSTAKDALMGAVEGKLPIIKADGTIKPIKITLNISYDPTTGDVDIEKVGAVNAPILSAVMNAAK
tara:strand:+ start:562 stop:921 length:360 start_codon:yes stop_codon:yes gene_type:complete